MEHPEELSIPEDILRQLAQPELFAKQIEEGKSLQEIIGYSDEVMQELYTAASEVFEQGRYEEARDGFLFLTTINPYVYAYWLGLGMSYQLLEEYEQAILAYESAALADKQAPQPDYYIAACSILLGENNDARIALESAKQKCYGKEEHKELMDKIHQAEKRIKR